MLYRKFGPIVAVVGVLALQGTAVQAAIDFVADPTLPAPAETALFTHDPYEEGKNTAERNIATTDEQGQRNLRQSFQLGESINIGQIILSLGVQTPTDGLQMRIYEVDDINATWNPGTLVHQFAFPQLVASDLWFGINFTGGNVFNLPARNTGSEGYGIEFSDNIGIVGANLGFLSYNNEDPGIDHYANGRFFTESGGSSETRDIGLILVASTETPCDPGDVNCDMVVNEADLGLIAANFRKTGDRSLGDLSGDGFIDFDDFGEWKENYGGPGLGAEHFTFLAVPEPASLLLIVGALLFAPARRSRR